MTRTYKINGKTVSREIWHDHLLTGNWEVADLYRANMGKVFETRETENVITPERARELRGQHKQAVNINYGIY